MAASKLYLSLDPSSGIPTDVAFVFEGQNDENGQPMKTGAHKYVLAVASDVFKKEFFGSFESEDEVLIVDASKEVFQVMLDYIYDKPHLRLNEYDADILAPLYYLAEKYIIPDLSAEIIAAVADLEISRKDVLEVAVLADASPHQPLSEALLKAVHSFLEKEFENDLHKIVKFLTEADQNGKHALVIYKLLMVEAAKEKKCRNCKGVPCLNNIGVTSGNFVSGAKVKTMTGGHSDVFLLVRKEDTSHFTGATVSGITISRLTLNMDYYRFDCA